MATTKRKVSNIYNNSNIGDIAFADCMYTAFGIHIVGHRIYLNTRKPICKIVEARSTVNHVAPYLLSFWPCGIVIVLCNYFTLIQRSCVPLLSHTHT